MQNQPPPVRSSEIRYRYEFFAQGEADFDVEAWNRFEEIFRRTIPTENVGDAAPGIPQISETYAETTLQIPSGIAGHHNYAL